MHCFLHTDYYPFGMLMPNRHGQDDDYRYGFNGALKDNEIKGNNNSYDFGARMLDPRIGRWLSVDALESKFPSHSPYNFVSNTPIIAIDPDGKDIYIVTKNGSFKIAKETLLKTPSGKELWEKYSKSKKVDVYITAQPRSSKTTSAGAATINSVDGTSLIKNNKLNFSLHKDNPAIMNFSSLNGVDVTKSKGKTIVIMALNTKHFKTDASKVSKENVYNNAEALFHELKAHVDLRKKGGDGEQDHEAYGKKTYNIFSETRIAREGSPAAKISNELKGNYYESLSTLSAFEVTSEPNWRPPMLPEKGKQNNKPWVPSFDKYKP